MSHLPIAPETPLAVEITGLAAWDVFQRLACEQHLLFLDSASPGPQSEYSYLLANPFQWLSLETGSEDAFALLRDRLNRFRLTPLPDLPPLQGGLAGMFGYDLAHGIEKLPRPAFRDFRFPDLAVGLYDCVFSFDHRRNRAWLVATGFPADTPGDRRRRAHERLDEFRRLLDRPIQKSVRPTVAATTLATPLHPTPIPGLSSNFREAEYLEMVRRGIEYVHAGDCFQVNLAQRLIRTPPADPIAIYEQSRTRNPAPFSAYFDLGDFVLASASPERFLRLQAGAVETRPIKGTRPRHPQRELDDVQLRELQASAKDRAENIMIVDLLRNDLGRVCQYGSIQVPVLCGVESYQYVHHLVSQVCGRLRPEKDALDLLKACFPGGSVTGAPKIRAMEIIAELERGQRGPYCGSLGWIGFDGAMDTSILIRTMVLGAGWLQFHVGGGIVADSDPQREYQETWHKAEGLLRALR